MASESEPKEFVVSHDEDSDCSIELDIDINYRPCKNHFRLYSRFDTTVGKCEYEYKMEGTSVLVRLLEDKNSDPGEPDYSEVRDGVVEEATIRERDRTKGRVRIGGSVEEDIQQLKKVTEWTGLSVTAWGGFPYFVLGHNLPRSDARRYFRQELQRLTNGEKAVIAAAAKLGYEPKDTGRHHPSGHQTLQLIAGWEKPSEEQSKSVDLPGIIASVGLTYEEFTCSPKLIAQLRELLGDESQVGGAGAKKSPKAEDSTKSKPKGIALVMKAISWFAATVLMAGYYAFALMLMWNWFVAGSLHLPEISFIPALGLIWTISLLKSRSREYPLENKRWELLFSVLDYCVPENKIETVRELIKKNTEGIWADLAGQVFGQAVAITITLGLGWAAHTFFL